MSTNPFILANLREGESCKEVTLNDSLLFTEPHYNVIRDLIAEDNTLTHIGTRIFFRHSSVDKTKVSKDTSHPDGCTIDAEFQYDVTVMVRVNHDLNVNLVANDILTKIYTFIKPSLLFH